MNPLLESTTKWALHWLLPNGAKDILRQCYQGLQSMSPDARSTLARNAELKGKHQGKRCFILATGPSIRNHDLSLLENEICISVSNFFVHSDFYKVRPLYHCITPLHKPLTKEDGLRWFRQMEPYMDKTNLILAYSDKQLIELNHLFNNQKIFYLMINRFGDLWDKPANQSLELTNQIPVCQSVSIMALILAIYIGCSEIYLLGTDHTVFSMDTGQYAYGHFYDGESKNSPYWEQDAPDDMENEFRALAKLWRQYKHLRIVANKKNVTISNATGSGILDLFPRVDYNTLF